MNSSDNSTDPSRRRFLKTSGSAALAGATAAQLTFPSVTFGRKPTDKMLKVALIGCGGRGTGAAAQALTADSNVQLSYMADAFPEKIESSLATISRQVEKAKINLKARFTGLEAYKRVLESDADVVILTTPPGFRPGHLVEAVKAGKHIFTEKPMATDAPGVRLVREAVEMAKKKELAMVAGFCWRYDYPRMELFKRIHGGEIGQVRSCYGTYLTGPVKPMPPAEQRPAGMSDLEWMVRNWYNFTWLSGDGLVEQAVHTVDWIGWCMKDAPPVSCTAVGGRQIPAHGGTIYDHVEVNYLWDNHTRGSVAQRQITGCHNENNFYVLGSDGEAWINHGRVYITGKNPWRYEGPKPNMYQVEHDELFKSIREGEPINNGDRMINSTLMAIMGREAGYTGKEITWDMISGSKQQIAPQNLARWEDEVSVLPLAQPGRTRFI